MSLSSKMIKSLATYDENRGNFQSKYRFIVTKKKLIFILVSKEFPDYYHQLVFDNKGIPELVRSIDCIFSEAQYEICRVLSALATKRNKFHLYLNFLS